MAMPVVLSPAENQSFRLPRSRSKSSTSLFVKSSSPSYPSTPKQRTFVLPGEHRETISWSPTPSSLDSSPRTSMINFSNNSSLASTPSTGLSFEDSLRIDDEGIDFPNYGCSEDDAASRRSTDDDAEAPEISTSTDTTRSESPLPTPTVVDDTAIQTQPSQHVDYLSHDWREEDIWSSWRHIVSQRKVYGQRSRLENASWRTWAKAKYRLRTISPETLNWLKESDVTWLYGPLKLAQSHPITSSTSNSPSHMSKSASFVAKKPILKKRSVSEVMLQKSLSTSSLLKQAAASVQAQKSSPSSRRGLDRIDSDLPYNAPSQPPSRDDSIDYFSSRVSSAVDETPSDTKEKHIRFDEVVEQCVSKDPTFDDDGDDGDDGDEDDPAQSALSESSSDEGLLMMQRRHTATGPKFRSSKNRLSRSNSSSGSKMIETIEATTLKYRTDSPDVTQEQPQHHTFGQNWSAATLSPSPSQETLRPSRPSRNFLLAEDDDPDDDVADTSASWSFGANNPRSSLGASAAPSTNFNYTDGYVGMEGMRRTESGMFMPIEDDEDDLVAAGLFGRVSETVNTVKDIGWVLWNSLASRSPEQ